MFCQGLELQALPYLGIYDTQGYQIFSTSVKSKSINSSPPKFRSQISELASNQIPISEFTIEHNCGFLDGFSDFVDLNLIFQSYIFYDCNFGESHSCTVHLAVYQDDSDFSSSHLSNQTSDSVAINPDNILTCKHFTCIHPDNGSMCLSPNNARIKVATFVPLHVFYTIVLVPYKGKVVRGLATKHLLVINKEKFESLTWLPSFEIDEVEFLNNLQVFDRFGHQGFFWYFFKVIWIVLGKPKVDRIGEKKWQEWSLGIKDEDREQAFLALRMFLSEVTNWLLNSIECFS